MTNHYDETIKILIVDDDEDDFILASRLIKSIEGHQFEVDWCPQYDQALQAIEEERYHIYLIDYYLGKNTGLEFITTACRKHGQLPLILLTGNSNQHIGLQAMKAGAMDYLVKNELDRESMLRSIRYVLERDKALKALLANEKKFRMIFERSNDAIVLTTPTFKIIDCNPACCTLLSSDKQALLSHSLQDFIEVVYLEQVQRMLEEKNEVIDMEMVIKHQQDIKHCLLSATIEQYEERYYYQLVIHDISSVKKAAHQRFNLQKREMIDRMVQALAHEVRNPLNNINLSIEQISTSDGDDDKKVLLDILQRNSDRIQNLISNLLQSSRSAQLERQHVCLQDVIKETIYDANDRLTLKKIHSVVELPSSPIVIDADAIKLKIALLNIINNAIEAMEDNGCLTIKLEPKEDNRFLCTIADTGCGIAEDQLPKLFDPYHTTKKNGMGLGLATSINILHSHQVEVEVDSVLNEGTTFKLLFTK